MKKFFEASDSVLVTHYQGLTVNQLDELRIEMRNHGMMFKITKNRITKNRTFVGSSFIKAFEIDKHIANKIITRTSFKTVTPITVFVNGPFARISFITAIAEDGDRATNIVANNTEIPILCVFGTFAIKGM